MAAAAAGSIDLFANFGMGSSKFLRPLDYNQTSWNWSEIKCTTYSTYLVEEPLPVHRKPIANSQETVMKYTSNEISCQYKGAGLQQLQVTNSTWYVYKVGCIV